VAGQRDDARRVIRREQIRSLSLRVSAPHLHKTVCCSLPHAVIIIWSALYRNNKPKGGAMISETQMDELADKLSGQDLELGIKAATITIETAMRQCHSQIDTLERFIAILQHRENETLRQENEALRKKVKQLEEKLSVA
jgi:hypothetical protein